MSDGINQMTTHDLWVESRQFKVEISRPTDTTITLKVTVPSVLEVVDGAVLTLSKTPINANEYPQDSSIYVPSTVYGDTQASSIGDAQVVGFWSKILSSPFPTGTLSADKTQISWEVTVSDTDPNTIYYGSIHGVTNVLQYYPIGIQSYPLEASRIEKDSSVYTGSIPSLPSAPLNPAPNTIYYDQQLNLVQYWDVSRQVWIPTRADTILSGAVNPGTPGQTYFVPWQKAIKVFDGQKWVLAKPDNFVMRCNNAWVALNIVSSGTELPNNPVVGDIFYNFTSDRIQFWDGSIWKHPDSTNTLLNNSVPSFSTKFTVEPTDLPEPYIGLLFYNTTNKILNAWTGLKWEQANTDQQGTPTTDKVGVGTDGSYDERLRLIKVLKAQLGHPVQCVELTEEQFNVAIDNALDTYRQLSQGAYERRFILYSVFQDQQMYYLNSPVDGTDKIVQVQKIHRLNILGTNSMNWDTNVYFQTFLSQYYSSGHIDILSIHLMHSLSEEFQRIFAGDLMFTWSEAKRELFITRRIARHEKVVLEVEIERSEQELLLDRWCKQFIQGWALAELKEMLGLIRSKYTSGTPGPNGNITLNGDMLIAEARQDFTEWKEALLNYEHQNAEHASPFLIG